MVPVLSKAISIFIFICASYTARVSLANASYWPDYSLLTLTFATFQVLLKTFITFISPSLIANKITLLTGHCFSNSDLDVGLKLLTRNEAPLRLTYNILESSNQFLHFETDFFLNNMLYKKVQNLPELLSIMVCSKKTK